MTDFEAIAAAFGDDPGASPTPGVFAHAGPVWRWKSQNADAPAAWFFVTIDGDTAAAIRRVAGLRRGFGSIRVNARIGLSTFATSLFPAKALNGFLLPVKASVRKAEGLAEGSIAEVELVLA
jgi:hypothetical protein